MDDAGRRLPSTPLPPELDPRGRRAARRAAGSSNRRAAHGRGSGILGSGVWLGVQIVAAVMSLMVLLGSGYAWATYRNFAANVTHVDAIAPSSATHPRHDIDGTDQNILLVGDDHRPANASPQLLQELSTQQDGGGVNTDTMMVLHVPADGSKATLISFPRDSWVTIPGFGQNKLNSAFQFGSENGGGDAGGARLLINVIENMTGLTIDHFVRVSMVGFYQIAQVLGPIQVCLKQAAVDSYSGTNLPAGVSMLDAKQALSFVRQRHNLPGGDLDREVRQQYFLSAEFHKIASAGTLLDPFKLQSLLAAVSGALETDPGLDLVKFAQQMQNLQAGNLKSATIPITGTPTINVGGSDVSIVAVDFNALPGFIAQVIGRPTAYDKAKPLAPASVSVTVLNGSGIDNLATQNTALLKQAGFQTGTPDSAPATTTTTIEYPAGSEAQAKTVAGYVPGAIPALSTTVHTVTLILGSDSHQVRLPVASAASRPSSSAPATAPTATPSTPARAFGTTDCIN